MVQSGAIAGIPSCDPSQGFHAGSRSQVLAPRKSHGCVLRQAKQGVSDEGGQPVWSLLGRSGSGL